MLCRKCVLPENKPDITLNTDGVCNICLDSQKKGTGQSGQVLPESEVIKILNKYKGSGKHDCLVMCSGGKDSTLSLYYMKKRYKMNPLAFTFDHGFENEEALENIRNAVDILGVDWLYYKSDFMKGIFTEMLKSQTKVPLCHVCAIWYLGLTLETAKQQGTPLIVAGWTKGQFIGEGDPGLEYRAMSRATEDFVKNHLRKIPQYKDFSASIGEALKRARRKIKAEIISPHWFLRYDPAEAERILERELNWQAPKSSYPRGSTNCLMNFVSVYLSMKNYGYSHYHIEMSKLIRMGELSRQEALKMLEIDFNEDFIRGITGRLNRGVGNKDEIQTGL